MKDLLLYMAKSLVDDPDSVTVTEVEGETTVLELRVAPEDMGKLIGRQGRIAKEIRTIIKSVAQRTGQKGSVEIVDSTKPRALPSRARGFLYQRLPFQGSWRAAPERLLQICSCLMSPTAPSFLSQEKRWGEKRVLGRVWCVLLLNSGKHQCFGCRSTRDSPYGRLGTRGLIRRYRVCN